MAARSSKRSSILGLLTGKSSKKPDDGEWQVGGRYEALFNSSLYDNPKLTGKEVLEVKSKDAVLLLKHQISPIGSIMGFVLSPGGQGEVRVAGWMPLKVLRQQRLDGSWEMRARYRVKHPATLRTDIDLSSMVACEVVPGEEVIVLEIGVYVNPIDSAQTRLRLKVSTCNMDPLVDMDKVQSVGWMSAETAAGDKLLDPVNLLGMDAVKLHRASVLNNVPAAGAMKRLSRCSQQLGVQVGNPLNAIPWQVGGQYRVLEKLPLRQSAPLASKKLGQLPAGAVVTVTEIHMMECAHLGWCPCAFVSTVGNTSKLKLKERRGWIRCAAKDGRNLLDERDQLEFEKVTSKLAAAPKHHHHQHHHSHHHGHHHGHKTEHGKKVQVSPHPPEQREISGRAEAEEDYDESDWSGSEAAASNEISCFKCGRMLDDEDGVAVEDSIYCSSSRCENWACYVCAGFESEEAMDAFDSRWYCKACPEGESETDEGESVYEEDPSDRAAPDTAEKLPAALQQRANDDAFKKAFRPDALADAERRSKELQLNKRLQAMEISSKDDKMVDDKTIIQDASFCGCNCGAKEK